MTENFNQNPSQNVEKPSGKAKKWGIILALFAALGVAAYAYLYQSNVPNQLKTPYIKIKTGTTFEVLVQQLKSEGFITDVDNFLTFADYYKFNVPRAGRFKIEPGMSSIELVRLLQRGEQAPVKVTLNNERTPGQVAAKLARSLELDSATFMNTFSDAAYLKGLGIEPSRLMCYFLPNTYEIFWNITPQKFVERMQKEFNRFWTPERLAKAKERRLSPEQVITMAAIVEGESNKVDERPKVAGVYLNRYYQNMRLQADPTVQYALMDIEKTNMFRRLYNVDYRVQHPYNTYVVDGLPPGPVCMPSPSSIDAVLKPEPHNYLFFCAKPDGSNYHNYAVTYEEHLANVRLYTASLKSK